MQARTLGVLLLAALIVPAAAYGGLFALRELHLGLRMQPEAFRIDYLLGAAENRATGEVKRLVRWGVVPATAADAGGYTALMAAARGGDPEMVGYLLEHGALVNAKVERTIAPHRPAGLTALMRAAASGHAEAVRLLLDRGADPNAAIAWGEHAGMSALMLAVHEGHGGVVDQLLARGTRTDLHYYVTRHGVAFYPLTFALRDERLEIAEKLVRAGSDVDWLVPAGDYQGYSQLMLLCHLKGRPPMKSIAWVAERTRAIDYMAGGEGCRRCTAMYLALWRRDWDLVKLLADAGALRWTERAAREARRAGRAQLAEHLEAKLENCILKDPACRQRALASN